MTYRCTCLVEWHVSFRVLTFQEGCIRSSFEIWSSFFSSFFSDKYNLNRGNFIKSVLLGQTHSNFFCSSVFPCNPLQIRDLSSNRSIFLIRKDWLPFYEESVSSPINWTNYFLPVLKTSVLVRNVQFLDWPVFRSFVLWTQD